VTSCRNKKKSIFLKKKIDKSPETIVISLFLKISNKISSTMRGGKIPDKQSLVLLEGILREQGVDYNHLNSYDNIVAEELSSLEGITVPDVPLRDGSTLVFRFGRTAFRKPVIIEDDLREVKLYPRLAKQRRENYCARMYVDIHVFTLQPGVASELPEEVIKLGMLRRRQNELIRDDDDENDDDGLDEIELAMGVKHRVEPLVYLTAFPVMVGSRLCRLHGLPVERLQELGEAIHEPGGYFIMRGKERVIVPQKNMSKNTLFISDDTPSRSNDPTKAVFVGTIHCCSEAVNAQRVVNRVIMAYEKELQDFTIRVAVTQVYNAGKGVPLGVLLAALGMSDWQTVIYNIASFARIPLNTISRLLQGTGALSRQMFRDVDVSPHRAAWEWLSERVSSKQRVTSSDPLPRHPTEPRKTAIYEVIHNWLLTHVMDGFPAMQTEQDYWAVCRVKALMLCKLTADVIRVSLGLDKPTNKDRMENKRYDSPGYLLVNHLFREYLRPQLSDFRTQIAGMDKNKKPIDIVGAMCSERLQKGLASGLQSGKFHTAKRGGRGSRQPAATGVSQALSRLNMLAFVSHLKKVAMPTTRKTPANARQLDTSQWGFFCVAPTTHVLLGSSRQQMQLQDLAETQGVGITVVDPKTRKSENSQIAGFQRFNASDYPNKRIVRIETNTGRFIVATGDHLFYTPSGEVAAENITKGAKLLTMPTPLETIALDDHTQLPVVVLNTNDFITLVSAEDNGTISRDVAVLEDAGLLPLMSTDARLPTLARLAGYANIDGHVTTNVELYMGEACDAKDVIRDADTVLKNSCSLPEFRTTHHVDNAGKETVHNTWRVRLSGPLGRLLVSLGAITGKKSVSNMGNLPDFVTLSGANVKRAYLSGLFGGDGGALWYYLDSDATPRMKINAPRLTMTKDAGVLGAGVSTFDDLKATLMDLEIETTDVITLSETKDKVMIQFSIVKSDANLLAFCDQIGYAYCCQKQHKAALVSEYLRYRVKSIKGTEEKQRQALELFDSGLGKRAIARALSVTYGVVNGWIQRRDTIFKTQTYMPYAAQKIDEFLEESCADISTGTLYTRVVSVEHVNDCPVVMDLTTESAVHTFVANGFVTHNCLFETPEGQSCGNVNHLAMLGYVSLDYPTKMVLEWFADNVEEARPITDLRFNSADWRVLVNGKLAFSIRSDEEFVLAPEAVGQSHPNRIGEIIQKFKDDRSRGALPRDISISVANSEVREINVWCDGGRPIRPVCIVKNGVLQLTREDIKVIATRGGGQRSASIEELFRAGKLELLDGAETEDSLMATFFSETYDEENELRPYYTHCEVSPVSIMGISAGLIPFADRNQSPRNVYQCLWEEELVLMGDGTQKMLKEIEVGEQVICFDPKTMESNATRVTFSDSRETDKNIVKITTVSGRQLVLTDDHLVMTADGWTDAKNIQSGTPVAVSLLPKGVSTACETSTLLDRETFTARLLDNGVTERIAENYAKQLESLQFLPLLSTNAIVPVLARIFGFLLADGSICIYQGQIRLSATFGSETSSEEFERDVVSLGFERSKVLFRQNEYLGSIHSTWLVQHQNPIGGLMVALGYKPGKMTTQAYPSVPNWILQGSKMTKREFLGGLQGGDGCQICWNPVTTGGFNFVCGRTLMTARDEHAESLRTMMDQVVGLFTDLGVEAKRVEQPAKYEGSIQCGFDVSDKGENLVAYFQTIGYRYCDLKRSNSGKVVEYLLFKKTLVDEYRAENQSARELIRKNGITSAAARASRYNNGRTLIEAEKPSAWKVDHKGMAIFVPVKSVEVHRNVRIADITTESECHSFIAGDAFCVHNSGMGKQALGTPSLPLHGNMRPTDHVLENPEHPLVDTILQRTDALPFKWLPSGQNCTVFVNAYAHNVEDSLILSRAFLERGGLASYTDRTYIQTSQPDTHNTMERETFERPDPERTSNYKTEARYDMIGSDGLPTPGVTVTSETVIIGKTGPLPTPPQDPSARNRSIDRSHMYTDPNHTRKDQSVMPRKKGGGIVQEVTVSHARDNKCVAVTIRTHRTPRIGDKLAARHGQKGIVSRTADVDELPMMLDGTSPDIVMNPHAFPSRMTVGQTLEGALGNVAAMTGVRRDATMFFGPSRDEISQELFMLKLNPNSEKRAIDPKNGELMEGAIYEGTIYYQDLKHLVEEKVHARARGPVTKANKQPVEGRRRDGGLRIGEMEKETIIAHGATAFGGERTCGVSDPFRIPICEVCGRFAHRVQALHLAYKCENCDSHDNIKVETIPYVLKQFVHYLLPMGIDATFVYGTRRDAVE
jgi:DNA-directed RNA polymerase beta subunit